MWSGNESSATFSDKQAGDTNRQPWCRRCLDKRICNIYEYVFFLMCRLYLKCYLSSKKTPHYLIKQQHSNDFSAVFRNRPRYTQKKNDLREFCTRINKSAAVIKKG